MDTITLDLDAIRKLEKHEKIESAAEEVCNAIAARARETAPVDSGAYRDSIVVQKSNRPNSGIYRVYSSDPKASWIEFGNGAGFQATFNIRNAAEALGLKFEKKGG